MSRKIIGYLIITTLVGAITLCGQKANALTFNFTQQGWTQGGILSGSFSGEDLNNDNLIEKTEVTDFSFAWSGNSSVPSFKHDFSNLFNWEFSLSDYRLINGSSSRGTTFWSYDDKIKKGEIGIVAFVSTLSDTTVEPPNFSQVPEPLTILGTGTALLFGAVFKGKLSEK
ncbi:PEP-CTERM sorting domain-containing protein [Gloeothece verrucosa]|uniref:Uncharacterized protein n=1 Tax=Gloeothece verrucosa (strain PCC 7822) TaxID=497965 RepID=E0UBM6_GLOV7|nr:PEP-CTERM sorting domain-containing protein [Gloeothece verrucosa]ADN13970.1 hypothetical protein Cyan7822_1988 [Gloeothece verrucosa PCC 7822]